MTHPNKRKGNAYERELVNDARANGLDAERAWGSDGRSMGMPADVDLVVQGMPLQCKRVKQLPKWLGMSDSVGGVAVREDRGETYVLVRWDAVRRWLASEGW